MKWTAAAVMLSLACASAVVAAAGPDPIVATRQSSMKEMAAAAKTIAGM
ncbi:cytochrome c, partial [Mesorhizobium sp. M5C.F.Ca.IN.020.32.2.1]